MTIKVMIVDDSAVVRQVMTELLTAPTGMSVIAVANDPVMAMERMKLQWPDVLVLDIEMPRMDGITFLRQIMATRPTPVVICSSLTQRGSEMAMVALAAGAVEVIPKPTGGLKAFLQGNGDLLVNAVRAAAQARMARVRSSITPASPPGMPPAKLSADAVLAAPTGNEMIRATERIVVVGTSTGGTQALEEVLTALPRNCPGLAIVQHMPERFTASFADRLNRLSAIEVKEAAQGDKVMPGRALIAPGGKHMVIRRSNTFYHVEIMDGPPVSRHKPSVDVLFRSAAKCAGKNALAIIMTGMGDDGARGMRELFDSGAYTLAQDEDSCVVYGMPKEAVRLGGVNEIVSLGKIASLIAKY